MFTVLFLFLLAIMVGFRPTRKFALSFLPWYLFGISYTVMAFYPNYKVNSIDVGQLYELEKSLFGMTASSIDLHHIAEVCKGSASAVLDSGKVIPGEYFTIHHNAFADILAGLFYLCWVPVPLIFAFYLYFSGKQDWASRFSWCFLFVNLLGFIGYYVHPASPPWYVMNYGFEPILNTPGNMAGFARFDEMTGTKIFHFLYANNSNVFAAIPSLHSAYLLVTTAYAVFSSRNKYVIALLAFICMGIWWAAVYTSHHYIIDVMLGIITAFIGIAIFEIGYRKLYIKNRS